MKSGLRRVRTTGYSRNTKLGLTRSIYCSLPLKTDAYFTDSMHPFARQAAEAICLSYGKPDLDPLVRGIASAQPRLIIFDPSRVEYDCTTKSLNICVDPKHVKRVTKQSTLDWANALYHLSGKRMPNVP